MLLIFLKARKVTAWLGDAEPTTEKIVEAIEASSRDSSVSHGRNEQVESSQEIRSQSGCSNEEGPKQVLVLSHLG